MNAADAVTLGFLGPAEDLFYTLSPTLRGSCLLSASPRKYYDSMDARPCVPLMSFQLPRLLLHSPAADATQPLLRFHLCGQANGPEPGELLSDLDLARASALLPAREQLLPRGQTWESQQMFEVFLTPMERDLTEVSVSLSLTHQIQVVFPLSFGDC